VECEVVVGREDVAGREGALECPVPNVRPALDGRELLDGRDEALGAELDPCRWACASGTTNNAANKKPLCARCVLFNLIAISNVLDYSIRDFKF
jgi:hypothetical protein